MKKRKTNQIEAKINSAKLSGQNLDTRIVEPTKKNHFENTMK